ncbi:HdeD family acid-resistance protein [Empedobacter falsenii]|uniref:HdeD family acid-resistance protein n=1 Tax=unclassified Empedobacter TaxID=2643773 RepID=UPI002574BC3D|nr:MULTISPECIES: HdeD family acid-resistance protein [unclassified Empedobacter]MDM1524237.1 HdeD family acid-resistance protein [Empedobacter sp. 225-1]MDM1544192.1 HdeD family acid-resistance protein [Empedobacter sp. 189-2]
MATFLKTIKKTVKHWYVPAIIGVLLIVFGIYIFTTPLETYGTLTMLFSLSFLFSGIAETLFSVQNRKIIEGWGWYLTGGIFNTVIGLMLLSRPEISAFTLPLVVGFTLMFRSIQGLGFSFELKNYGSLKWGNLAIASILGLVFSIILLFNPIFTGISLVVMTALAFIFSGITGIVLGFQLKKLKALPSKIRKELNEKIEVLKKEYYEEIERED